MFVVDRKNDVIITGGHNIFPLEVESILYEHPAMAICAVLDGPDATKGEIPVAIVVKTQGVEVTAAEIQTYCRERLSAYKMPRQVEFINEMPVEAAKIRKRDLVAALRDGSMDSLRRYQGAEIVGSRPVLRNMIHALHGNGEGEGAWDG